MSTTSSSRSSSGLLSFPFLSPSNKTQTQPHRNEITKFPIARTISRLGVHTCLLLFAGLILPRSTYVLTGTRPPEQASSRDKPQAAFLQPLTGEPRWTMGWVVLGVGVVLAVWASSFEGEMREDAARQMRQGSVGSVRDDSGGKEGADEAKVRWAAVSGWNRIASLKDAFVGTLVASVFFHLALVFFGAPLIDEFSKTYLLSLLLSLLTIFANAYILRLPSLFSGEASALAHRLLWLRLFVELAPRTPYERLLAYPVVGTLVGAWLGAIPIALDWDRPWQAWPLTPAFGALAGYIAAAWSALCVNAFLFLAETGKQDRTSENIPAASTTATTTLVAAPTKMKTKKGGKKKH